MQAAYNIGGIVVTANAIEHTIFCFRTPRIGGVTASGYSDLVIQLNGCCVQVEPGKLLGLILAAPGFAFTNIVQTESLICLWLSKTVILPENNHNLCL